MDCQYCGEPHAVYGGVDDGGGDYGASVCDQYHCDRCGNDFEANCFDEADIADVVTRQWYHDIKESIKALMHRYPFQRHGSSIDDIPF